MITVKYIATCSGERIDHVIASTSSDVIDGTGLTLLPALIDPHVHFRTPGATHKETWGTAGLATIAGGVTTVFDMPNTNPPTTNRETLEIKKQAIQELFDISDVHVRYHLWIGATPDNASDIEEVKNEVVGIKMFMGSSTGDLLVSRREDQEKIFELASRLGLVLGVHAEHEETIKKNMMHYEGENHVSVHSKIRDREVAIRSVTTAIEMAREHGTKTYILHTSTREELDLIRSAKKEGLPIYCEVTPHHLFLNEEDYARLGTKGQMNPPLRTAYDNIALWQGITDGTVDTIGTDHAPHTLEEKMQGYGHAPSGVPGIENYLALLLHAEHEGRLTLDDIVRLTHTHPQTIFGLEPNDDVVLVDRKKTKMITDEAQKTKCAWSPYSGMTLTGWPVMTIMNGKIFKV